MTCHVETYHDDSVSHADRIMPEWGWQCFTCPADSGTIFYTFIGAEFEGELHAERIAGLKDARGQAR
jgi:hypothetical protein